MITLRSDRRLPSFLAGLLAVGIWALSVPHSALSQERLAEKWTPDEGPLSGEEVRPCLPNEKDFVTAQRELQEIGARIESLAQGRSPRAEFEALKTLLKGPCFELAPHWPQPGDAEPQTAIALQEFWRSGGERWFAQFLALHGEAPLYSWTAPTLRKSFGSDLDREHPLASLLCPLGAPECGLETRAWERRARAYLDEFSVRQVDGHTTEKRVDTGRYARVRCRDVAVKEPRLERWSSWMHCLQQAEATQAALPLGHMKAPDSGWWLIKGRRGHYSFCDEIRAYHLQTGAAYVVSSCGQLVALMGGPGDESGSDKVGTVKTRVGRLSLDVLREAAWMAFLAPEVQDAVVLSGTSTELPPEVTPARLSGQGRGFGSASQRRGSSAQTRLNWSWSKNQQPSHSGGLLWPEDYDRAAYNHAVELLKTAEASFAGSCAPEPLPRWLAESVRLGESSAELIAGLGTLVAADVCSE